MERTHASVPSLGGQVMSALRFVLPVVVSVTIVSAFANRARSVTVVSPSGFENTEGNRLYAPFTPFPTAPPLETPDGWRGQELHSSSAFASLGPGPFEITELAWRPDVSVNAPVSTEWEMILYASTTTRESLSTTFADN